jgi:hypothetical protein
MIRSGDNILSPNPFLGLPDARLSPASFVVAHPVYRAGSLGDLREEAKRLGCVLVDVKRVQNVTASAVFSGLELARHMLQADKIKEMGDHAIISEIALQLIEKLTALGSVKVEHGGPDGISERRTFSFDVILPKPGSESANGG